APRAEAAGGGGARAQVELNKVRARRDTAWGQVTLHPPRLVLLLLQIRPPSPEEPALSVAKEPALSAAKEPALSAARGKGDKGARQRQPSSASRRKPSGAQSIAAKTPTRRPPRSRAHTADRPRCRSPARSRSSRSGHARAAPGTSSPAGQRRPGSRIRRWRTADRPPS